MKKITIWSKYWNFTIQKEIFWKKRRAFTCICICGKTKDLRLDVILGEKVQSCGCMIWSHKMYGTSIYGTWRSIKDRCNNKSHRSYKDYGGRGITYDPKWQIFEGFYEDMGDSYEKGLTIDRIDNDGNYCKINCRWATRKEQNNNKRNNLK